MSNIIEKLKNCPSDVVQNEFCALVKEYLNPSYGSMSKSDFNILLFSSLQRMGAITENPTIYDLTRELRFSKTKAQALLYNVNLRKDCTDEQLDDQLRMVLANANLLKEKDRVSIEIEDPVLRDYLKKRLKELHHISDGSFSVDIVKMTHQAFADLYEDLLPDISKKEIHDALIEKGVEESVVSSIKKLVKKVLDSRLGDGVTDEIENSCKNTFRFLISRLEDISHSQKYKLDFDDKFLDVINK